MAHTLTSYPKTRFRRYCHTVWGREFYRRRLCNQAPNKSTSTRLQVSANILTYRRMMQRLFWWRTRRRMAHNFAGAPNVFHTKIWVSEAYFQHATIWLSASSYTFILESSVERKEGGLSSLGKSERSWQVIMRNQRYATALHSRRI